MAKILLLLPVLTLLIFIGLVYRRHVREHMLWDIPFRDDHERAPGESLRLKIEELNDTLLERVMILMFSGFVPFIMTTFNVPALTAFCVVGLLLVFQFYEAWHIWKLLPKLRNHRIGFDGERLTAQYLQPILCQGHFVYHDIPMKDYNVDHVIVGPNGVFGIETKARRKRRSAGVDRARVKFDGNSLQYPELKPEAYGLEAAVTRAKGLQEWLSSAVGESVPVQPILALPGWYVERTGRSGLPVMNPKSIPNFILRTDRKPLPDRLIKQIRHQLFEKSKVEAKT